MSNETNGGGSDLDIFEGLGKKASERLPAAPPAPPGSIPGSLLDARRTPIDAKRTLLGIPGPATPASMPAAAPVGPASSPVPVAPITRPSTSEATASPASAGASGASASSSGLNAAAPVSAAPPPSGQARPPSRPPPPPPGRGSLPNLASPRSLGASEGGLSSPTPVPLAKRPSAPPPTSARSSQGLFAPVSTNAPAPMTQPFGRNGAKLEMDWDDDNEATQVFDKEQSSADASAQSLVAVDGPEPERASMDAIMSSPPARVSSLIPAAPPVAAPPATATATATAAPAAGTLPSANSATLSGAFGALGQSRSNGSSPPSNGFRSGPSTTPSRSAPPPPPASLRQPNAGSLPPPPPPGQVTTAPMYMPLQPPQGSVPPAPHAATMHSAQSPVASLPPQGHASVPPPSSVMPSAPPAPQLPPVSRAMEATHMVVRQPSKAPLYGAILAGVAVLAGAVAFFMPRTGTLVVNVADTKGGAVQNLEVLVDGTKRCDSAPCIVNEISAGVHEVKVVAKGYEALAPRAVTVDSKRDVPTDFQLSPAKTAAGTGFKVAATHSGVKLAVDGKDIGLLPQELRDLGAGEHKLHFSGERYAPLDKTVSIAKDEIVDIGNVTLKVLKGKATIQLGTPGAKVYLVNGANRKEVPQFPMAIEFDPNEKWELQGTKDGFDEYREKIAFDDGQSEKTYNVTLSPKGSSPSIAHVPAAAFAPQSAPVAPAAPVAKAAAPAAAPVEAPKKEAAPATAGGESVLKINSLPAASIVLDGKPIGVTPQTHVVVSPGSHTIMFVNSEQSLKKTITVDVKAGETKPAFAKLRD